ARPPDANPSQLLTEIPNHVDVLRVEDVLLFFHQLYFQVLHAVDQFIGRRFEDTPGDVGSRNDAQHRAARRNANLSGIPRVVREGVLDHEPGVVQGCVLGVVQSALRADDVQVGPGDRVQHRKAIAHELHVVDYGLLDDLAGLPGDGHLADLVDVLQRKHPRAFLWVGVILADESTVDNAADVVVPAAERQGDIVGGGVLDQ